MCLFFFFVEKEDTFVFLTFCEIIAEHVFSACVLTATSLRNRINNFSSLRNIEKERASLACLDWEKQHNTSTVKQ